MKWRTQYICNGVLQNGSVKSTNKAMPVIDV